MLYKQENVCCIRKTPGTSRNGYLEVVCLFKCFSAGSFVFSAFISSTVTSVCLHLWGCCSIVSTGIFCEVLQWWALKHICKDLQLWASEHLRVYICTTLHLWALEHLFFTIVDFYIYEHTNIRERPYICEDMYVLKIPINWFYPHPPSLQNNLTQLLAIFMPPICGVP